MHCLFCKIIAGEIPSKKVYEDEFCLGFEDINPVAPVHILLIPKAHCQSAGQASEQDLGKLFFKANEIAKQKGLDKSGYRLLTNIGQDGGQTVNHMHIHIVGGKPLKWEF